MMPIPMAYRVAGEEEGDFSDVDEEEEVESSSSESYFGTDDEDEGEDYHEVVEDLVDGGKSSENRRRSDSADEAAAAVEDAGFVGDRRMKKKKLEEEEVGGGGSSSKGGGKRHRCDFVDVEGDDDGEEQRKKKKKTLQLLPDVEASSGSIDDKEEDFIAGDVEDMGKRLGQPPTASKDDQEECTEPIGSRVEEATRAEQQALPTSVEEGARPWMVKCLAGRGLRKCINMDKPEVGIQPAVASDLRLATKTVNMEEDTQVSSPGFWDQLLEEILHQILKRLSPPDWHSFGSVCKSWRSALMAHHLTPMLVRFEGPFPRKNSTDPKAELVTLCFYDGKFQRSPMKLSFYMGYPCLRCLSCGDGWLGANYAYKNKSTRRLTQCYLVNPVSGAHICLPPIRGTTCALALSSAPTSADCRVFATGEFYTRNDGIMRLATCKLGDREWSYVGDCPRPWNMMIFHKGRLYLHSERSPCAVCETRVYVFDDTHAKMIGTVSPPDGERRLYNARLVDAGNDLLLVVKDIIGEKSTFRVFKLEDGDKWIRIGGIGGRVLLIDDYNSVCLSAKQIAGSDFRANCIYTFTHGVGESHLLVFSMDDGYPQRLPVLHDCRGGRGLGWWLFRDW